MITLYTTKTCPKCKVLKMKLDQNNIEYIECNDIDEMTSLGIQSVPMAKIDDELMSFGTAVNWLNEKYGG